MEDELLLPAQRAPEPSPSMEPAPTTDRLPRHLGVIIDGNRRWARATGASTEQGHRAGAARIPQMLAWCEELGIPLVTVWMLSTDNFSRPAAELEALYGIIAGTVEECAHAGFQVRILGDPGLLPGHVHERIGRARAAVTSTRSLTANLAIGYGGREEILQAVREIVREGAAEGLDAAQIAESIDLAEIGAHLSTRDQPDPDLIIRTSGEQRMSGFLLWQSVHTEFWFCDTLWPEFRRADLVRALRDFARRDRRFGS